MEQQPHKAVNQFEKKQVSHQMRRTELPENQRFYEVLTSAVGKLCLVMCLVRKKGNQNKCSFNWC